MSKYSCYCHDKSWHRLRLRCFNKFCSCIGVVQKRHLQERPEVLAWFSSRAFDKWFISVVYFFCGRQCPLIQQLYHRESVCLKDENIPWIYVMNIPKNNFQLAPFDTSDNGSARLSFWMLETQHRVMLHPIQQSQTQSRKASTSQYLQSDTEMGGEDKKKSTKETTETGKPDKEPWGCLSLSTFRC